MARLYQKENTHEDPRQLYLTREEIALNNRENPDGTIDQIWDDLHSVINMLGRDGMSSDESEVESDGRKQSKVFRVKRLEWRSPIIGVCLARVDRDYNVTNGYGNTRAGNPPRRRERVGGRDSTRDAIPKLPINFYGVKWYQELSTWDKRCLDAGEEFDLETVMSALD
jgi:hypothetical protein